MSRLSSLALLLAAALLAVGAPVTAAAGPDNAHASADTAPMLLPVPEGAVDTTVAALDGPLVVGTASDRETGDRAIAWDLSSVPATVTDLGAAPGPSRATGVSGRLVVGVAVVELGGPAVPVAWMLDDDHPRLHVIGRAGDTVAGVAGRLAVGSSAEGAGTTAVAWDLSDLRHPVRIELDPGRRFAESAASAIHGTTVAGTVLDGWTYRAAAWDLGHGMPILTILDSSAADSAAYAIGSRFAAGYRDSGDGPKATSWDITKHRPDEARALAARTGSSAVATDGDLIAGYAGGGAVAWEFTASGPLAHPLVAGRGSTSIAGGVSGRTVAGSVTDARGRTTAATWTVGFGHVELDGLLGPLAGAGVVNTVRAGQVIPLRFRLHVAGQGGVNVDGLRVLTSSRVAPCPADAPRVAVEGTVPETSGVGSYGDGLYRVTWSAAAGAAPACRELTVTIDGPAGLELDRTSMRALFEIVP